MGCSCKIECAVAVLLGPAHMHIDQNRTESYSQIDMTFILILMEMVMIVKLLVHIILVKKEGKRSYQRCNSAHIITEILIM